MAKWCNTILATWLIPFIDSPIIGFHGLTQKFILGIHIILPPKRLCS